MRLVENCCLTATITVADLPPDLRAATLRLRRNTVLGNACVYVPILALPECAGGGHILASVNVEASQNAFYPALDWPVFLANYGATCRRKPAI